MPPSISVRFSQSAATPVNAITRHVAAGRLWASWLVALDDCFGEILERNIVLLAWYSKVILRVPPDPPCRAHHRRCLIAFLAMNQTNQTSTTRIFGVPHTSLLAVLQRMYTLLMCSTSFGPMIMAMLGCPLALRRPLRDLAVNIRQRQFVSSSMWLALHWIPDLCPFLSFVSSASTKPIF